MGELRKQHGPTEADLTVRQRGRIVNKEWGQGGLLMLI
jgi:hypothetical protein